MNKRPQSIGRAGRPAVPLGLLACLLAWACYGCAPTSQAPSSAAKATTALAAPAAVQVTGERAEFDLGAVKSGSKHRVAFDIHNDSDKQLKLVKIRGDCSCIASAEAPEYIAPGQVARVVAVFTAPDLNSPYGSELIILTDDPLRKTIRLGVRANIHR
jgi:hypothetical protein